jgi:uncharacterized surface protein with fasciclin (FAS1) repeats
LQKLPQNVTDWLAKPASYPILAALIRTHILPGDLADEQLRNGQSITTVEGWPLSISDTCIRVNDAVTATEVPSPACQANLLPSPRTPAANGAIYKIDTLLDPFLTYFGEDAAGDVPEIVHRNGTVADVIATDPDFSTLYALYQDISPFYLVQIALFAPDRDVGRNSWIYLAPSNTAFDVLPAGALDRAREPGNSGFTGLLLGYGDFSSLFLFPPAVRSR